MRKTFWRKREGASKVRNGHRNCGCPWREISDKRRSFATITAGRDCARMQSELCECSRGSICYVGAAVRDFPRARPPLLHFARGKSRRLDGRVSFDIPVNVPL